MIDHDDTIVAVASPPTPAARGVVRISGESTLQILAKVGIQCPATKQASRFQSSITTAAPIGPVSVDVLLWPSKRSYTGQPSAEIHTYGSLPILQNIVEAVIQHGGRAARPGEFTMRAFLAGKLDLTQAEAVLGVIEADGERALEYALSQLAGNLAKPLHELRNSILNLLADVEAGLDFVDEDIQFISDEQLVERLSEIDEQLYQTASKMESRLGGAARTKIVLRGRPNAGKSSLFNCLVGHAAAIVTDAAGTTRDVVAVNVDLGRHPIEMIDTAGIDHSHSPIEAQSQSQGKLAAEQADVYLWCCEATALPTEKLDNLQTQSTDRAILVATKSDRCKPVRRIHQEQKWIYCSALTGDGIDKLVDTIVQLIESINVEPADTIIGTAARCAQSIAGARQAIATAIRFTRNQEGHEFVSAELRLCANHLGEVTGMVYTDDILDRVFGRFCIGK